MRERRNNRNGRRRRASAGGSAGMVAAMGLQLWTRAAHHPVDSAALLCAVAASLIIVVNATFLQSGPHPAPFLANPTALPQATDNRPTAAIPSETAALPHPAASSRTPPAAPARRNDPIADLIGAAVGPSSRIMAVQRILSEFGYGQLRLSGTIDEPTSAAIQKFESEHKMPVTGRLSDRLLNALAAMTGHPVE